MHSNFITAPDYIENILVINATDEQLATLTETVKTTGRPYNIYFYNNNLADQAWFNRVASKADIVIYADKNDPMEYFNK
jgi:hypothetical protein